MTPEVWESSDWAIHQYARAVRGVPGAGAHVHLSKFNATKLHDRGRRVSRVKHLVREAGLGFGVDESDELDAPTQAAILRSQTSRGLVEDGIVGPKTFAKLMWPA